MDPSALDGAQPSSGYHTQLGTARYMPGLKSVYQMSTKTIHTDKQRGSQWLISLLLCRIHYYYRTSILVWDQDEEFLAP